MLTLISVVDIVDITSIYLKQQRLVYERVSLMVYSKLASNTNLMLIWTVLGEETKLQGWI